MPPVESHDLLVRSGFKRQESMENLRGYDDGRPGDADEALESSDYDELATKSKHLVQ